MDETTAKKLEFQKLKFFEAYHFSFRIFEETFKDLYPECCKIQINANSFFKSIGLIWGLIDQVHRLRELAQGTPQLSTNKDFVRIFLNATTHIEQMRHYIQHFRNGLGAQESMGYPAWGSLSWLDLNDSFKSHTAILGSGMNESFCGLVFDTQNLVHVSKVSLEANGSSFHADLINDDIKKFKLGVYDWYEKHHGMIAKENYEIPISTSVLSIKKSNS